MVVTQGNIRNDESDTLLQQLGMGLAGILAGSAVLFQIAKRATVTPRQAADWLAQTVAAWASEYGVITACVLGVAAAMYTVAGWGYRTLQAHRAAADAHAQTLEMAALKISRRTRRVHFSRLRAAEQDKRSIVQQAAIAEEESVLAMLQANQKLEGAEEKARSASLWKEAGLWSAAEQVALDGAAEVAEVAQLIGQDKWDRIAARVNGRTAEECLVRVRFCRHRAMLEAEASMAYDDDGDDSDDDFFGNNEGTDDRAPDSSAHAASVHTDDDDEPDSEDEEDGIEVEDDEGEGERLEIDLQPARKGTEILLEKTQLWKIGTVRPATLRVQCVCIKCSTPFDADLDGDFVAKSFIQRFVSCVHPWIFSPNHRAGGILRCAPTIINVDGVLRHGHGPIC